MAMFFLYFLSLTLLVFFVQMTSEGFVVCAAVTYIYLHLLDPGIWVHSGGLLHYSRWIPTASSSREGSRRWQYALCIWLWL